MYSTTNFVLFLFKWLSFPEFLQVGLVVENITFDTEFDINNVIDSNDTLFKFK